MHLQNQDIERADVVDKSLNLAVIDLIIFKVVATHFKHIFYRDVLTGHDGFCVDEFFVLVVEFAEFAHPARLGPEAFSGHVDQAVFVIDWHTIRTIRRQGIHHEGARRSG